MKVKVKVISHFGHPIPTKNTPQSTLLGTTIGVTLLKHYFPAM